MLLGRSGVRRLLTKQQVRWMGRANSSRWKSPLSMALADKSKSESEWWVVDGELHEIGDNIPPRERFVIPRDNIPNRRRKQLREQFMRRTRLDLRDSSDQGSWCKQYMELYQELRENWERLYWDEGYSKKIAQDHADYESEEDDDADFSPYRRNSQPEHSRIFGFVRNNDDEAWQRVRQVRDKFEFDRERRMREKAFAPMDRGRDMDSDMRDRTPEQHFDARKFFPRSSDGERDLDLDSRDRKSFQRSSGVSSGFNSSRGTSLEHFDVKSFFPSSSGESSGFNSSRSVSSERFE